MNFKCLSYLFRIMWKKFRNVRNLETPIGSIHHATFRYVLSCRKRRIQTLIREKASRFSRDQSDLLRGTVSSAQRNGVHVTCIDNSVRFCDQHHDRWADFKLNSNERANKQKYSKAINSLLIHGKHEKGVTRCQDFTPLAEGGSGAFSLSSWRSTTQVIKNSLFPS